MKSLRIFSHIFFNAHLTYTEWKIKNLLTQIVDCHEFARANSRNDEALLKSPRGFHQLAMTRQITNLNCHQFARANALTTTAKAQTPAHMNKAYPNHNLNLNQI